jgi:broad specificity phosphatase PhoE
MRLFPAAVFMAAVWLSACATEQDEPTTTVILVRHAEKMVDENSPDGTMFDASDPPLTEIGTQRAQALAHVLGEAGVDAVYSTPFVRARLTALPLAELLGKEVREVAVGPAEFGEEMATIIRSEHVGDIVVVVSHSNTGPAVVEALGVESVPIIDDDEYDDLYIVTINDDGGATLLALRYGRETP